MMTTLTAEFDINQQYTHTAKVATPSYASAPRNTHRVLAVRQCITEINGSAAISANLVNGWCLGDVQSISIPPKINDDAVSLLVGGHTTQLDFAGSVLGVDRKLDQEIDTALATYYERFDSSAI